MLFLPGISIAATHLMEGDNANLNGIITAASPFTINTSSDSTASLTVMGPGAVDFSSIELNDHAIFFNPNIIGLNPDIKICIYPSSVCGTNQEFLTYLGTATYMNFGARNLSINQDFATFRSSMTIQGLRGLTVTNGIGTSSFTVTTGHINSQVVSGSTVTSCGSGPLLVGSDNAGTITVGSGVTLSCTLTFAQAWRNAPTCTMTINMTGVTGGITTISTTQAVFSFSATVGGGQIYFHCIGSD